MKQFILGALFGSMITGTIVGAASLYDTNGQPAAPRGSVQQFDYFRQRQLFIDQAATRRAVEEMARQQRQPVWEVGPHADLMPA